MQRTTRKPGFGKCAVVVTGSLVLGGLVAVAGPALAGAPVVPSALAAAMVAPAAVVSAAPRRWHRALRRPMPRRSCRSRCPGCRAVPWRG